MRLVDFIGGALATIALAAAGAFFAFIGAFKALPLAMREWIWVSNGGDPTVFDGAVFTLVLSMVVVVLAALALRR